MREFADLVLQKHESTAFAILKLFALLSAPEQRKSLVEEYFNSGSCLDKSEVHRNRLGFGYFSDHDLLMLLLVYKTKTAAQYIVNSTIINFVVERLSKFGLVSRGDFPGINDVKIAENSMPFFNDSGLAHNIVFGLPYMISRVSASVPAVNVKNSQGDIECGSGIIVKKSAASETAILLTNQHVLHGRSIVEVLSNGRKVEVISQPEFHETADLAALKVRSLPDMPIIPMNDDVPVLTPVVSLGYPRVALASGQPLLAHKGEINGSMVALSGDRYLIISCHVGPGNSGGPIVTEAGFCAGIVAQSGIGRFGTDKDSAGEYQMAYHMAIPPSVVSEFLAVLKF